MNLVRQLLAETLASGELDRQLIQQHRRWWRVWEFGDFREEVLLRALTRAEQFRGSAPGEFLAWLRRLGWSAGIDRWRQCQRERGLLRRLLSLLPPIRRPGPDLVATRDYVQWLLAGLNERERQLLVLRYYEQKSAERIAEALGMTIAAVNQLHYRALEKLRKKVQADVETVKGGTRGAS